ncbi:MAG TPA: VOC family protein [Verrucomicrobiae bacterium]|nr:VOC family protein [Verrucomicrobiae bacterium]
MLKANRIIAFVATANPSRAKKFYKDTLGLRFVSENEFAVVFDAGGIMLRVTPVKDFEPTCFTVLGWVVEDITKEVRELVERGVKFQRYDWMKQDEDGVWTSPDNAKVAWFTDPDGNILSLTEFGREKKCGKRKSS